MRPHPELEFTLYAPATSGARGGQDAAGHRLILFLMQGRMFSMIRNPGRQDKKTKTCFTIRTIYNHAFMGNIVQRCEDKIKDSPQRIRIDLPLGFIGPS